MTTPWQDAVEDAVHDTAPTHGLDPDTLLDVSYDDNGDPTGAGLDFAQRLDHLADADPNDEHFAQAVAAVVAQYAADLKASPADFLERFSTAQRAGLSPGEAQEFAGSGLSLEEWQARRSEDLDEDDIIRAEDDDELDDDEAVRAAGHDVTPGHDELHHWWTKGPGLTRWVDSPHQFTTLRDQLVEEAHVTPEVADRWAAAWVHEVTGFWPGSDMHRVEEGGKPRGHRIGPG